MSTGRKFRLSFVLRCVWPVFGMGVLLAVQAPVQAAPSAYVVNSCASRSNCSNGTVSVIDTATNAVTAVISVGNTPRGVAVSLDGSRVYVANACAGSSCSNGTVSVIDTATNAVTGSAIPVGNTPLGVAVSPDGSRVYVANANSSTVSVIDTANDTVTAVIPVGNTPFGVAVNPDSSRAYVTHENGTVSVIDTANDTVTAVIPVGHIPVGVAVSPDGSRVYVANQLGNTVSVIDTATNQVVGPAINVGVQPESLGAFVGPGALIATNTSASGVEGEQISGAVPALTNTTGCATSDAVIQNPAHGNLAFDSGTGTYTYTPSSVTYVGPDAFTWNGTASGTCAGADNPTDPVSNVATVTFTLTVPPPVASGSSVSTAEGQAVTGQLNASAPSGQTLTYALVTGPVHGTVMLSASTGAFTYTPAAGFAGVDSFTFDATDSGGTSNTATEGIGVLATPGVPPVASGGGGTLGLDSLGVLGAGLFFSRSRRKKRLSPG